MRTRLSAFLLAAGAALAQPPQPHPPQVVSPEVAPDHRVTFRFYAPNAHQVTVSIAGAKAPFAMQKDNSGVWAFTSEAMEPDLYGYTFDADGGKRLDPANSVIIPNLLNPSSEVHVPGASPLPWEDTDVPHGSIHHHFYRSAIVGDNRDFYVYTPPGYDPRTATLYPVLYLLHGYSDDASGWTAVGRANLIMDSLIAAEKAKPMIIVMPLGYGDPAILHRSGDKSPWQDAALRARNYSNFGAALIDEVVPMVERSYRVDARREARAIAGLSMGGAESLLTGLNRLDLFAWVASFSAGGFNGDFAVNFPQLSVTANSRLRLLWIACGTEDRLITPNRAFVSWLKGKQIEVAPVETPGMHTWMVWRRNLISLTPLLFRNAPADTARPSTGDRD